jgi:hypothetical protein
VTGDEGGASSDGTEPKAEGPEGEDPEGEDPEAGEPEAAGPTPCAVHPSRPAEAACGHCGTFSCGLCLQDVNDKRFCQACIDSGRVSAGRTPWEERASLGWLRALWQTIKNVTIAPTSFFRDIEATGRLPEAAGFCLLVAIPGSIIGAAMQFLIGGVTALLPLLGLDIPGLPTGDESGFQLLSTGAQAAFILIFGAPLAVVGSVISGCIHHFGLRLVGGGEKGLEASVKGSLYASAVRFWSCIPMFKFVTDIWTLVLQGVAYCQIHRNPGWKGAFAVLYATCLCLLGVCGIGFIAAVVIAGLVPSLGF